MSRCDAMRWGETDNHHFLRLSRCAVITAGRQQQTCFRSIVRWRACLKGKFRLNGFHNIATIKPTAHTFE